MKDDISCAVQQGIPLCESGGYEGHELAWSRTQSMTQKSLIALGTHPTESFDIPPASEQFNATAPRQHNQLTNSIPADIKITLKAISIRRMNSSVGEQNSSPHLSPVNCLRRITRDMR